ncbi:MAG: MFS transporter [Micromonosporaceae bacterium]|nr:MFS transporter [Micromonosporaceae bacterium]
MPLRAGSGSLSRVLGSRGFRRLLGVRLVSQLMDGLFQAALAGSLLFNPERAADPIAIATGFTILLLPYSAVGPYVGVLLDRWSRRTVVSTANLIRAALVLPAALLIWNGVESLPCAILALVIIGINRFFLTGLAAAIPHVVQPDVLVTGNAVFGTLGVAVYSAGVGGAATVLNTLLHEGFHGYAALAAVTALGYAGSGLLTRAWFGVRELGPDDTQRGTGTILAALVAVARGMVAGARHLAGRSGAAYALLVQGGYRLLFGVLTMLTLLLYRRYFNTGVDYSRSLSGLALIFVAGGVGALVGAFVTPPLTRRIGGWRWVAILMAASGILLLPLGLPFRAGFLVAATFVIGGAGQAVKIIVDTTLQRDCLDDFRGRVFSVNDATYSLTFVVGLFAAAVGLPANGHSRLAVVLVCAGYLALALWYDLATRRLLRQGIRDVVVAARQTVNSGG